MTEASRIEPRMSEEDISSKLVPVIVGGDILAYSYVREFHRAYGITRCIIVLGSDIKMLTSSRFTDCRIIEDSEDNAAIVRELLAIGAELVEQGLVPLLLGCDDRHAVIFSSHLAELEGAGFVVPYNSLDLILRLSDKRNFYEIAEELGVPYPKTWYFPCGEDAPESLPIEDFPFPLVMKPTDQATFLHVDVPGKRKVYEVESPDEVAEIWDNIRGSEYNGEMIVQDFIPGTDENLRILNTFTDPTGDVRVVSGGIVALQDHCPSAIGNPLVILGEREERLISHAKTFLAGSGFKGWAAFDIKYDPRIDDFCFFEINIRMGRSSYYISLGGVNFVVPIVEQFVLGKEIPYAEAYDPFVYDCVPRYVIDRSIEDPDLKKAVLTTLRKCSDAYPLRYKPDTLMHNLWARVMFFNQIRKFKRYLWDTNGQQYKG